MSFRKIQEGERINYLNTTGLLILAHAVVAIADHIGVAVADIAIAGSGEIDIEGVFEGPADTGTAFVAGADAFYDPADGTLYATPSATRIAAGWFTEAKAQSGATAKVKLGGGGGLAVANATTARYGAVLQAAVDADLTDNGGGTADGTVASQAAPVTLTDNTGGSGSHDDTLAAVTTFTPSLAWNGTDVHPSAADATAIGAAITTLNQNQSDAAQKIIELVTLATTAQNNLKELTTEIADLKSKLRTAGILATA